MNRMAKYRGVTDERTAEKIISEADVLANVSGACWLRPITAAAKNEAVSRWRPDVYPHQAHAREQGVPRPGAVARQTLHLRPQCGAAGLQSADEQA